MSEFSLGALLEGAKEPGDGYNYIGLGSHDLILDTFEHKAADPIKGTPHKFFAGFYVEASELHKPGERVSRVFVLADKNFAGQREQVAGELQKMIKRIIGTEDTQKALAQIDKLAMKEQPGRGLRVKAKGFQKKKKDGSVSSFVNVDFTAAENTKESVAQGRALIEGSAPAKAEAPPAQVAAPAPAPAEQDPLAALGLL